MSALQSMIKKLSPLRVYDLSDKSCVYAELSAFSVGLDVLRASLEELLKEGFVLTAESFGLSLLEQITGCPREDLSVEERREMITQRQSLSAKDFTLDGVQKVLKAMGVEGEVTECPDTLRMYLDLRGEIYSSAKKGWFISQARELLPAHLEVDIIFSGFHWGNITTKNLTFKEMDEKFYTWDEIDYLI